MKLPTVLRTQWHLGAAVLSFAVCVAMLAAASLGFGPIDLFNMPEAEREVPKVALR